MEAVRDQYERWPYPRVPLLARVHREQLWQLHLSWLAPRCGQSAPERPKIWIAGCGTFQPYIFSRANPHAEILATDLSQRSLDLAQRRCRFHGIRGVRFERVDLEKTEQLPAGPFDFVECYGVLMSLADPKAALRQLAARLAPQGILRLMAYPHYSRRRIFQIQRLAKLLGLRHSEPKHPALLRRILQALPPAHPLRVTFLAYPDSGSEEGIVDGFLHASDRGFTAIDLLALTDEAGLTPAFYFHRPWGQPEIMAKTLGMQGQHAAIVLDELDAWQELRTNFTICFVRKDSSAGADAPSTPRKHPLFDPQNRSVGYRHRARLLRLALSGAKVTSRTHAEPLHLSSREIRALLGARAEALSENAREILPQFFPRMKTAAPPPPEKSPSQDPLPVRVGPQAPNPLYSHLFEAWSRAPLARQIERWQPHADPLEDERCPWGLTPLGTLRAKREEAEQGLLAWRDSEPGSFRKIRLREESKKRDELHSFLKRFPQLQSLHLSDEVSRELWILLFSFPHLVLSLDKENGS